MIDDAQNELLVTKAEDIKRILSKVNIDNYEIFVVDTEVKNVLFTTTRIVNASTSYFNGYSLRLEKNSNMFFISSDNINNTKITENINNTINSPQLAFKNEHMIFADNIDISVSNGFEKHFDSSFDELTLTEITTKIKNTIKDVNKGKSPIFINSGILSLIKHSYLLTNSNDLHFSFQESYFHLNTQLTAGSRKEITFSSSFNFTDHLLNHDPNKLIINEIEKLNGYLKYKRVRANRIYPIVFSSRFMCQFLDTIVRPFLSFAFNYKDGKILPKQLSNKITIIEESANHRRLGSLPLDHEGIRTVNNQLYDNGNLKITPKTLTDSEKPTGNALRGLPPTDALTSFKRPPQITITNIKLKTMSATTEELISDINKGVFIDGFAKINYFDLKTGDFEFVTYEGLHIKNGQRTKPFGELKLFGNIIEMLSLVELIGKDITSGYFSQSPSIKVERMHILGKPRKGH